MVITITCSLCGCVHGAALRAVSACLTLIGQEEKVLIQLVSEEGGGGRPPERLHGSAFGLKGKSGFRGQSSLFRICHTMRWLRSAFAWEGCSFMGGGSPSSPSTSSSPEDEQRDGTLVSKSPVMTAGVLPSTCSTLTHPEVDVALSPAHHQHGLGSFLSRGICRLLPRCLPPAGSRWICMP